MVYRAQPVKHKCKNGIFRLTPIFHFSPPFIFIFTVFFFLSSPILFILSLHFFSLKFHSHFAPLLLIVIGQTPHTHTLSLSLPSTFVFSLSSKLFPFSQKFSVLLSVKKIKLKEA